jgi:hypothetical protein
MKETFAGRGGKRPQIEVSIDKILLDDKNPRLVQYISDKNPTEIDLIKILYKHFDTESVALSLCENGYFDEEPLIIVPNNLPEGFKFEDYDYDTLTEHLKNLIENQNLNFTVVEGNRRVSTIKMLTDNKLRDLLGIDKIYPKIIKEGILADITSVPCIIYNNREEVNNYLGVRHIAGLLKWEAFAKAAYITSTIELEVAKGKSQTDAIKEVQNIIGDRSDILKKQYILYKLFKEAKEDLPKFNTEPIVYKFSLLNVLYNSPTIREYMGAEAYSKVNFDDRIVPAKNIDKLEQVLTWVFGNDLKNEKPVLTDSRQITSQLSHVVASEGAIEYLNKYKDLDGAYERSNGEKEFLMKNLNKAYMTIRESLTFAYKYKVEKEILEKVSELEEIFTVLKQNLS